MKVYVADMEKETIIEPPVSVRAYLVQTVEEFKNLVAQVSIYLLKFNQPFLTQVHGTRVFSHLSYRSAVAQ